MLQRTRDHEGLTCKFIAHRSFRTLKADSRRAQRIQQMPGLGIREPAYQVIRRDTAYVADLGQLLLRGRHQPIQAAELTGQHLSGLLPHLPNTKGIEQACHALRLGLFDRSDQIFCRLLPHAIQPDQVVHLEPI